MIIHVYTTTHNEAYMLPFFLRHYSRFADQIFILDDASDDGTRDIACANPKVTLVNYPARTGLHESDIARSYESAYRSLSRGVADWVMFPDCDELICTHDGEPTYLITALDNLRDRGVHSIKLTGYTMVHDLPPPADDPRPLTDLIPTGVRERRYDKPIVFDPALDVRFGNGRHGARFSQPNGDPAPPPDHCSIKLLHYCYLGWPYIVTRLTRNFSRMTHLTSDQRESELRYRIRRAAQSYDDAMRCREQVV